MTERKAVENMTNKLGLIILLFIIVAPSAVFALDNADELNGQSTVTQSTAAVEQRDITTMSSSPAATPEEQQQTPQDYQTVMTTITQKFSAALASISDAVQRGELSGEQGKEISAELFQRAEMQFELLNLWREIDEQDSVHPPSAQENPTSAEPRDIVMVPLPFSSLQLNPSLAEYLRLTPAQVGAIQRLMAHERQALDPLRTQLRITREKLLAIGSDDINQKEVNDLSDAEAGLLAKLIVANARMQFKIYRVLSPDQRVKLKDLERTSESAMAESK
jgi:hypothetical protein